MTVPSVPASYQGHYAGSVSRFAAYAIDLTASTAVFSLALAAISYAVQIAVFAVIFWFLEATNQMSDLVQSTTAS